MRPGGSIEAVGGQAQDQITERRGIKNRRVQDGRDVRQSLFVELELLGFGRDRIQRLFAASIGLLLVGQEIRQSDPAMAANRPIGNDTLIKEPDQIGSRYIQEFGGLVRG